MKRVTEVILVEVMDDRIVRTSEWSPKNRRDSLMSRSSVNGESKVGGQWTKRPIKYWCQ